MSNEANPPDDDLRPPDDGTRDGHSRRAVLQRSVGGGFAFAGIGSVRMITAGDHDGPGAIDAPTTVDQPGRYVLEGDISAEGEGIEIAASDVTVDGGGHRLEGDGGSAGVQIRDGARGVTVENLTVRNFRRGVDVGRGSSLTLASVTVEENASDGVQSGGTAEITCEGSTIRRNGGSGIDVYDDRVSIRDCEIRGNAGHALRSSTRATAVVEDSVVADNGGPVSLPVTAGSRVERTLIEANDGPGLETAPIDVPVIEVNCGAEFGTTSIDLSMLDANDDSGSDTLPVDGPQLDESVLVRGCEVRDNAGPGIEHTHSFLEVRGCTLAGNEVGYRLQGGEEFESILRHNVIEDNGEGGAVAGPAPDPKAIDATCNWWGDGTGPRHRGNPLDDPSGQSVSDRVQFLPWSTERPEDADRSEDAGQTDDADKTYDADKTEGHAESCAGGLEAGEDGVGYVSKKSYRRIVGADPYGASCWHGTFYITDPSDVDRNGFDGPGALLVGADERLAGGHVIRAEADTVPVTLPTWGGKRGDCESVLFLELNQPLSVDREYRITDVRDPSPYREDVDTNGFSERLDAVVRVAFEPVESDASADDAAPLR